MKTAQKAWFNLLLYLFTVGINAMGAFGVINGMSQKEVSDAYATLITPNSSTFSIWGVIYVLLLFALVFMAVKHREARTAQLIDAISVPFWVASVANMLWIVAFSFEKIGLSTLLIGVLVVSLTVLNRRLKTPSGVGERLNALAFGLYNGWLIIATVVNVSAFLVQAKWDRFGLAESTWALLILIAAMLIALLIQLRLKNAALTLPLAWAYFGIWQAHQQTGPHMGQHPQVAAAAIVIACLYLLVSVVCFVANGYCVLPARASKHQA